MINKKNKNSSKKDDLKKCNNLGSVSLLKAEEKIKQSKFKLEPASEKFKLALKNKLLETRRENKTMKNIMNFSPKFKFKQMVPVVA
ncbi:hypothetical protein K8R66_01865, partial [bacterium]|nr:hypothetical protein [bacterium]